MGVPDREYLYVTFIGALVTLIAGVLLLIKPSVHVILLAMLFLTGGEAVFLIWGINRTHIRVKDTKENRSLWLLFLTGLFTFILAIVILLFREYLTGYVIQLTALGTIVVLGLQWNSNAKLYSLTKKNLVLTLLVTIIILTAVAALFVIIPPFTVETRFKAMAFLCFLSSGVVLFNYVYSMWMIKSWPVPVS